jgi:two-component SAPR family response regulator
MKVICASMESFVEIVTTGSEESLRMVSAGIEMANESGIHVWDHMLFAQGVYGSLNTGNLASAADYLEQMKASLSDVRSFGQFHYHLLSGWYHLLRNKPGVALAHAENALKFISGNVAFCPEAMFTSHYEIAQVVHEQGDHERASRHMALAGDCVRHSGSTFLEYMHLMAAAQFAFDRDEDKAGFIYLQKALALGRRHGYISMFWWWRPAVMARLCQRALAAGIEVAYVENLVRKRKLFPETAPVGADDWPWLLKVRTLGRFEVLNGGKPVDFSGKRKLAELFKALISSGGTALREEQATDLLWPDADGDAAHNAFKMTMSRLRRLLPGDAIRFEDGAYSFNRRMVWADLWAFEQMCGAATDLWHTSRKPGSKSPAVKGVNSEAIALTEKILALYQGNFLPGDTSCDWTVSQRERLRSKLHRLTLIAGQHFEEQGKWRSAAEFYRKGLEADNLQEEFYQRLILCLQQLGQRTEALTVYERCRAELAQLLKIKPSPKTEALYAELRK